MQQPKSVTPYDLPLVTSPGVDPLPAARKSSAAKARTKKPAETKPELHPWDNIPEEATQTYVIDLPARLHCKLKWLGGMTWGSSMRKISIAALEKEADRLLAAKGVGVE